MKNFGRIKCLAILLLLLIAITPPVARAQGVTDAQVKSVFLYNFLKFVDLPLTNGPDSIRVCVVGRERLFEIRQTMDGKAVHDRVIKVEESEALPHLVKCSVVFFSQGTGSLELLQNLQGKGILSVGEENAFISRGGIINFYVEDDKVRFEVNTNRADSEGIRVSSQLLRIARIAKP